MTWSASDAGFGVGAPSYEPSVRIGVLGTGRIGRLHAELLMRGVAGATVAVVADLQPEVARRVGDEIGAPVAESVTAVLEAPDVDAVAICTSTDTHAELTIRAAEAGKAIFCEKPISLDLSELDRALDAVDVAGVPFMVGFNKRFDPSHAEVQAAVRSGSIGALHVLKITGRDPAPPPPEYVAVSGGIFLDMTIHDFDMARFITGSEVESVFATGAVRVDPRIGDAGDVDTAVVVLSHVDGSITIIDNSRRAVYGYDQRIEAFCASGMAVSDNLPRHGGAVRTAEGTLAQPLGWSFLDRYRESYRREWEAFVALLDNGGQSPVDALSARAPVVIALAAGMSMRERRCVELTEVG